MQLNSFCFLFPSPFSYPPQRLALHFSFTFSLASHSTEALHSIERWIYFCLCHLCNYRLSDSESVQASAVPFFRVKFIAYVAQ